MTLTRALLAILRAQVVTLRTLAIIRRELGDINERIIRMSEQQTHLDSDVQALGAAEAELVDVINSLKSQPGAEQLDFTAADALVAKVQGDATSAEAPAEPTPAPEQPVSPSDTNAPAPDVSAPADTPSA